MRIGIDAHFVGVRHGGNEVHFENLVRELARTSPGDEYFIFTYRFAARSRLNGERVTFVPLTRRSVAWQRAVQIPRWTSRLDLDLLHVPFNYLPVHRCKKVVTIHDLGFLRFPETYAAADRIRMRWLTRFAARHADHVFTVSHAAKAEIVDEYHVDGGRVTVTPNRISALWERSNRARTSSRCSVPSVAWNGDAATIASYSSGAAAGALMSCSSSSTSTD